jgi:hypothetical protein
MTSRGAKAARLAEEIENARVAKETADRVASEAQQAFETEQARLLEETAMAQSIIDEAAIQSNLRNRVFSFGEIPTLRFGDDDFFHFQSGNQLSSFFSILGTGISSYADLHEIGDLRIGSVYLVIAFEEDNESIPRILEIWQVSDRLLGRLIGCEYEISRLTPRSMQFSDSRTVIPVVNTR